MKKNVVKTSCIFSIIIGIMIDVILLVFVDNIAFAILLSIYFDIMLSLLVNYKKNILLICYLLCFFIFLIGRPIAKEFFGYSMTTKISLGDNTYIFVYWALVISIISIIIGYIVSDKFICKREIDQSILKDNNNRINLSIKKVSGYLTLITYSFVILENFFKMLIMKDVGYTASYSLESSYKLPYGLHFFVEVAPIALCMFLATIPSKKEAKFPLLMFFLSNLISAVGGSRFGIVSCILFILVYFIFRNYLRPEEKWLRKKSILYIIILAPALILLLQQMIYWRDNKTYKQEANPFITFMYGVGGSSDLIGITKEYGDTVLEPDTLYSFGNIWRNMNGNIIARLLNKDVSYSSQTIDKALNGHSLSSTLTYKFYPKQYLAGYGLGGCYVAELYHDFSYAGIIIGNIIIGFLIGFFKKIEDNKPIKNFIGLFLIILLFRIPRDSFDYFIIEFFGIKNIIFFLLIMLCSKLLNRKEKKE